MRTHLDRLRHTLLFEAILLAICTPLLSWLLKTPASHIGALSILLSLTAMAWNYIYNLLFDHGLKWLNRPLSPRPLSLRITHAILFEVGLLFFTVPLVMVLMNYSFLHALALDLGFVVTVPVYALFFNIAYDRIFPIPGLQPAD